MSNPVLDRLAADADRLARERRRVPGSTYRLQMHQGFTVRDATRIVPYLHALGVTHAYASPLLRARPGSTHGYDVIDHGTLNPEIGTEEEFRAWVAALREHGMGLLVDTVPNHMYAGPDNAWWRDVLEHGPSSPYAGYFDIAWEDHPRERLHGKVLLPILGEPYGAALESGKLQPDYEAGGFVVRIYNSALPVDPRTYGTILTPALEAARQELGQESPDVLELHSILTAVKHLPPRGEADPSRLAEGRIEVSVIKQRIAALCERAPRLQELIHDALARLAGRPGEPQTFAALDEMLDAQAYRLCFWRVASDEINYRRFFDVNELAALSAEREDVFWDTHKKVLAWAAAGDAQGLRIDHPDGLFDPKQYLDRLQFFYRVACARFLLETRPGDYGDVTWAEAEGPLREQFAADPVERLLYVVVEKILGLSEALPPEWACEGGTGYLFLNVANGLFVPPDAAEAVTAVYRQFTGLDDPFPEVVYQKKFLILQSSLASELHMLAHQLDRLAQRERWSRDFTLNGLRHALREVIAFFPVYRSYVNGGVRDADLPVILRSVLRARRRNALLGRQVFDFIRDTLLLKDPPSGPASEEYRAQQRRFAGKFQQVTAPVMAKGFEDTSFYVFNRLVSLNEVGGDPDHFGWPPAKVHEFMAQRLARFPAALSPLATHDTKRGEDTRARINVLAEVPGEWGEHLNRWAAMNRRHKVEVEEGVLAPDPNEEYLLYQTLLGAWPVEPYSEDDYRTFIDRIKAYMNKALHEAKVHTSWINPDPAYDAAVAEFVGRILDPQTASGDFLDDFRAFQRKVSHYGMFNSLAQTLLRVTAPGVPDTYQGTELWEFSLVDPDNRRPVDYAARERLLRALDEGAARSPGDLTRDLLARKEDGRVKLYVLSRALRFRREHSVLFSEGCYVPIEASGAKADHVFAFVRRHADRIVLIAVPRITTRLTPSDAAPVGHAVWEDTTLRLPEVGGRGEWANVFTGGRLSAGGNALMVRDVFADFPVALLTRT